MTHISTHKTQVIIMVFAERERAFCKPTHFDFCRTNYTKKIIMDTSMEIEYYTHLIDDDTFISIENIYMFYRLTHMWQYFGTLISELFLEIIRSSVDKLNFFYYADNLKVSTIV